VVSIPSRIGNPGQGRLSEGGADVGLWLSYHRIDEPLKKNSVSYRVDKGVDNRLY